MDNASAFEPTVFGAMWRYRWLVLLISAAVVGLSVAYALLWPARFEAAATIVVQDPNTQSVFETGQSARPERYVANQATILESNLITERASELIVAGGLMADPDEVVWDIVWDTDSDDIRVVVEAATSEQAIAWANAIVDAYSGLRQETVAATYSAALDQLRESAADLDGDLDEVQQDIDAVVAENPAAQDLADQYEFALQRLASLQTDLPFATGSQLTDLRQELDDVLQQLQTLQLVAALQSQQPELASLLEEQQLLRERRNDVRRRADELAVEAQLEDTGIELASTAVEAEEVGLDLLRVGAVGLVLGVLLAAGVAYLLAQRRRTFSDAGQPEIVLDTPLLSTIPDFGPARRHKDVPILTQPESSAAEAFRFVAASLRVGAADNATGAAVYAVVSGRVGDGKTVVAANTLLAAASTGARVLAVDGDFSTQRLTALLDSSAALSDDSEHLWDYRKAVGEHPLGLADFEPGGAVGMTDIVQRVTVTDGEFDLLSKGGTEVSGSEFLTSRRMLELFEAIRSRYDLVIIDTPPLSRVAYAGELVRYSDAAIVVVPHGGNVAPVEEVAERLAILKVEPQGYVYNRVRDTEQRGRSGSLREPRDRPASVA